MTAEDVGIDSKAHRRELRAPVAHDIVTPGDVLDRGNTVNGTHRDATHL